jgi:hypothetical protein
MCSHTTSALSHVVKQNTIITLMADLGGEGGLHGGVQVVGDDRALVAAAGAAVIGMVPLPKCRDTLPPPRPRLLRFCRDSHHK